MKRRTASQYKLIPNLYYQTRLQRAERDLTCHTFDRLYYRTIGNLTNQADILERGSCPDVMLAIGLTVQVRGLSHLRFVWAMTPAVSNYILRQNRERISRMIDNA